MSDQIIPFWFNGTELRSMIVDGDTWFVAADVARILGYRMASDMTRRLDADETGTRSTRTPSGVQKMTVISEPGLYGAIIGSQLSIATEFKRWVKHEVLPAIRKTGTYTAPTALAQIEPELPTDFLSALKALVAKEESNRELVVKVAELEPSAIAWDQLASAQGDCNVAEAAKILARTGIDTGPQRLFDFMQVIGWVFHASHGRWEPYAKTVDAGYLAMKPQSHFHPRTGVAVIDPPQVRVTLKGIERLRVRLTASKAVAA